MKLMHIGVCAIATLIAAPASAAPTLNPLGSAPGAADRRVRAAQAGPGVGQGKRMRPNHQKRAKIRQRIRALRAWRLTEALNLDEKSAIRLFPILNKYDGRLLKLSQQSRKLRRELRQQLKLPNPGKRKLNQLIDQSMKLQAQGFRLRNARFGELRRVLTAAQAAKLMVVLPEIDRRIQRQIRRAMNQGKGARGRRGGPNRLRKNPFDGPNKQRRRRPGRFKNPFDDGPPRSAPRRNQQRRAPRRPLDPGF